ncbi:hypothetical protein FQN60_007032 [Etheostoma spectabile]|uniref:Uncharacterized protein n=2 Tax=Etheostoma spectabile TaxID=54343 RepID=A0A5J5C6Q3_9PERO|nr:hypothetical protein FQN60_007032 [Etheostoma spectabile]
MEADEVTQQGGSVADDQVHGDDGDHSWNQSRQISVMTKRKPTVGLPLAALSVPHPGPAPGPRSPLTQSDVGPADSGSGLDLRQPVRHEVLLMEELVESVFEPLRHGCTSFFREAAYEMCSESNCDRLPATQSARIHR